jgi:putative ABC transport system permease protein
MRAMSTLLADVRIRMALGASRGDVVLIVLRRGAMSLVAGIACGIVAVLILGQVMTSVLYALDPTDPWVLGGSAIALAVIGLLASWWPAYRASRIDLQVAMREA